MWVNLNVSVDSKLRHCYILNIILKVYYRSILINKIAGLAFEKKFVSHYLGLKLLTLFSFIVFKNYNVLDFYIFYGL